MPYKFNPSTNNFDYYQEESDPLSLHKDQTTPQKVINGAPQFDEGITVKKDKFLYLDGT